MYGNGIVKYYMKKEVRLMIVLCNIYSCVWNDTAGQCTNPCLCISDNESDGPRCMDVEISEEIDDNDE